LAAMVKHVARGWTWPTLVLIGLGAIQALTRRNAAARTALALSAAGLLPCLAFSSRAAVHEFWILQAVPGLAILAALPVAALWQRTRVTRAWPLVALAIVAMTALGIRQGHALHAEYRTDRWVDFGRAMNEFVGPNDVVLYPNDTEPWRFYCEAATIPLYRSVFAHRAIMDALQPGRDEIEHLYVMWPSDGPVVLELQPLVGIGRSLQKIPDRGGYASLIEIDRQRAFDLFR
ncbi:MAG: hypothetical protein KDB53_18115, partial [Planctomycetes bacterium]|nr:hypothetical protein [Planctomycetota bacterium]